MLNYSFAILRIISAHRRAGHCWLVRGVSANERLVGISIQLSCFVELLKNSGESMSTLLPRQNKNARHIDTKKGKCRVGGMDAEDLRIAQFAWEAFAYAHPVEAYQNDPEGFWEYFHKQAPDLTRSEMVALLKESEEPEVTPPQTNSPCS